MGTIVEDIISPNLRGIARKYFQVKSFQFFAERIWKQSLKDPEIEREFDIIAYTESYFFINETKTKPRAEYAREFVDFLPNLAEYFSECEGRKIIPIFSSLAIPGDLQSFLSRNQVYCMVMGEENMVLSNFEEIRREAKR